MFHDEFMPESIKKLVNLLGDAVTSYEWKPFQKSCYIEITKANFVEAMAKIKEQGVSHISTIVGLESNKGIELLYALSYPREEKTEAPRQDKVVIKVVIDKLESKLPSIYDIFIGADFYEREIREMLGVEFIGNPNQKHLLLMNNWPKGLYPLRKEYSWKDVTDKIADIDHEP
ncbi:MAG: NADH-quinone oxidoreductase subunit C [Promethearchaeota archaeon]